MTLNLLRPRPILEEHGNAGHDLRQPCAGGAPLPGPRAEAGERLPGDTGGFYVAQRTLQTLVDAGLAERFEVERSKGRRYRLTERGRIITESVLEGVARADGVTDGIGTNGDTPSDNAE